MATSKTLERLPNEVLFRIVKLVGAKANTTHQDNAESGAVAESVIYESVTLSGYHIGDNAWQLTQLLIDRITDPEDEVSTYIRELIIENWPAGIPSTLVDVIGSLKNLRSLKFLEDTDSGRPATYKFTAHQCSRWKSSTDWSNLRILDLGSHGPSTFFEEFRGCVPNLKSLSFTLTIGGPPGVGVDNPRVIGDFLESINGLEELCVISATDGFFPIVWNHVKNHRSTLRTLKTTKKTEGTWTWTRYSLIELLETCPDLEHLTIDLSQEYRIPNSVWPREAYSVLSRFSNLHTLNTSINVISERNGPLGVEPSRNLAIDMAGNFFKNNPHSRLQSLEFTACKGQYAPIQEFWVNVVVIEINRVKGGVFRNLG